MCKKIAAVLAAAITLSVFSSALAANYLANPKTMKFHYSDCRTVKHPENFVSYGSREEAISDGYVPCKVCDP